ncbi:MAG TPA: anaerobic sulfatase maturase [Stenomitos sp.]
MSHFTKFASKPIGFHLLAKPTGAICNLNCSYCFFLSKEKMYPGSNFRMSDDLLESYIKQLLDSHHTREVSIAWQGGEPTLMGLDFFRKAVKLAEKHKKPFQDISHTIQTNGVLLNDEWCKFFKVNNVLVGISLDGPQDLHDVYRIDKVGKGTFERVIKSIGILKKYQVDFNILCTVNRINSYHPLKVYKFFRDEIGVTFLQFIPIIERVNEDGTCFLQQGNTVSERSVEPKQFGKFLIEIFDEWVKNDVGKVFVQHFDSALANWMNLQPSLCIFSKTCGLSLALEHNGDLYSCDHFVEPSYKLGNIKEAPMIDLVASRQQHNFGQAKLDTLPQYCRKCAVRFACHGECPKNRFIQTPDGEPGLNYLCEGYKDFFTHIDPAMKIMASLLRQNRYAEEIMQILK